MRGRALETIARRRPSLYRSAGDHASLASGWNAALVDKPLPAPAGSKNLASLGRQVASAALPQEIDPLYLFACYVEWEHRQEPSAAWELIAATQSPHSDTRAHARALLASSRHLGGIGATPASPSLANLGSSAEREANVKVPYGLDIVENCTECPLTRPGFFCGVSLSVLHALHQVSHKSTLPAGAILFVEGQSSRGTFILCSGRVNLSTTSREGKILILKTAEAGEALGLSSAISGMSYETTAETATPCQLSFVDRSHLLELLQAHPEVGLHTAQCLSRDFQSAYRDIHDLVLTRSSAGKLARLLLSQWPAQELEAAEVRVPSFMTHEEMAQRIGASRETVTRLLSDLKRKQLIRLEGPTLVMRNRTALEALAV
jgi:CRP/FNR family transcriptional regulator